MRYAIVSLVFCASVLTPAPGRADIATDGSLGAARTLLGPDFMIGEALGQRRGANLFHSFSTFSIDRGESATFTAGPGVLTNNIISRVTGGNLSRIDGRLASSVPGADLWLINPRGVVFGPDASLDLQGGLHTATASYVAFQDGGRFGTDLSNPENTLLSTAPVSAFGFIDAPEPVVIEGQLAVPEAESLAIAGGEISISGRLEAPSGLVSVVGLGSAGELGVLSSGAASNTSVGSFERLADIDISSESGEFARIRASGDSAGSVYIRGQSFFLDGFVGSLGRDGVNRESFIDIDARDAIIIGSRSLISGVVSGTEGTSAGPDIRLAAPEISIASGATVTSFVEASAGGAGGDVSVEVDRLAIGGSLSTDTEGSGDGGSLTIAGRSAGHAENLIIAGEFAVVSADSGELLAPADGRAGSIDITVSALTISSEQGGIFSLTNSAKGGDLTLNVNDLLLEKGSVSSAVIDGGLGQIGAIRIQGLQSTEERATAARSVVIDRTTELNSFGLRPAAQIASTGGSGTISVRAETMIVNNGGVVSTIMDSAGDGGAIALFVDHLTLSGDGASEFFSPSLITSSTLGSSDAGDIVVQGSASDAGAPAPSQRVDLSDPFGGLRADSFSESTDAGDAGSIALFAEEVVIENASSIGSVTRGGRGGSIFINADSILASDQAEISSATVGRGDGGDIILEVDRLLLDSANVLANAAPNLDQFREYQGLLSPDASLAGFIGPGDVLLASFTPEELNAPSEPFLFLTQIDSPDAGLLIATNVEVQSFEASSGPGSIRGASDALQPIQLLITGIGDEAFSGAHNESGLVDINLQFRTGGRFDFGNGGSIRISGRDGSTASSVTLAGDSQLTSGSRGLDLVDMPSPEAVPGLVFDISAGDAGEVSIASQSLSLSDEAQISVATVDGSGGAIRLDVNDLQLSGRALIAASTTGSGDAGSVVLNSESNPSARARIDGGAIQSSSSGRGGAGSVILNVRDLALLNDARVSVQSIDAGSAGTVVVNGSEVTLKNSTVQASVANSSGGNIELNVDQSLDLSRSAIEASAQSLGSDDAGGNIRIEQPATVTLNDSQIRADANAGAGGNIDISTDTIVVSAYSEISATSESNVDGEIAIDAVNQITGTVIDNTAPELASPAPLRQRCSPEDIEDRSSLVILTAPQNAVQSPYLGPKQAEGDRSRCGP